MSPNRAGRRSRILACAAAGAVAFPAPGLRAQDDATSPAPATAAADPAPLLAVSLAGPAHWRSLFVPTNVGSLLASKSGRGLWEQTAAMLDRFVQATLGIDDEAYAATRARALDYGGSLELALWIDGDTEAPQVVFRLLPDGKTDLPGLAADLASIVQRSVREDWRTGDDTDAPRLLSLGNAALLSEPFASGDAIVAVVTSRDHLATALRRARSEGAAAPIDPDPRNRPALALHLDVASAVETFLGRQSSAAAWRAAGLGSLGTFDLELATSGPHVRIDLAQQFHGDERGLFAALFPATQGLPSIANLLPHPDVGWKAGRFDVRALLPTLLAVATAYGKDEAELEREIEDSLGGDAETGLLSFFTDEYLLFGKLNSVFEPDDHQVTWGIAFRIRDIDGFNEKWKVVRKAMGLTELSEDDLGGGYHVRRFGGFFRTTALFGPDLFALIDGFEADDRVGELVTAARRGKWTAHSGAPERARPVLNYAPPGLNGVAEGNLLAVTAQVGVAIALLGSLVGGLPDASGWDGPDKEQLRLLLREHHLETTCTMTGYADSRWHFRALW